MKKFYVAFAIALVVAVATLAPTCNAPTVTVSAEGADFAVTIDSGRACLGFEKHFRVQTAQQFLDSLVAGAAKENGIELVLTTDSTGFTLKGQGCANLK